MNARAAVSWLSGLPVRIWRFAAALADRTRRLGATITSDVRHLREAALGAAAIAFIVWAFKLLNNEHLYQPLGFDEQHFVWGGWCVLKGMIPYKDFSEYKPPMVFLTHAAALALHGFRDLKFRWFFFYFPMLSLVSLYLAMRSRKTDQLCALALVLAIMNIFLGLQFHEAALSDTESIGLTYYFFGVACLIARTRLGDKLKAVGVGLLVCCAFSKEPYMPTVFFTWLACFLLDTQKSTWRSDAKRYLKLTAIGGGVVVVGLCLYLIPTGGMGYYLRMVRGYARIYKDPAHAYCVMFGRFTPKDAINDLTRQYEQVRDEFLNFRVLGYLAPFAAPVVLFLPRRSIPLTLATLLTLASGVWAATASKCGWAHYYVMTMAALFFAPILGIDAMTRRIPSPTVNRLVGWILLAAALAPLAPRLDKEMSWQAERPAPDAYKEAVPGSLAFIAKHTTPKDKIFTTGAPGVYVQAERVNAVRESAILDPLLYGFPGNTDVERMSGLKEQLERNKPKVVIIDPEYAHFRGKYMQLLITPFLTKHGYKEPEPGLWLRPN